VTGDESRIASREAPLQTSGKGARGGRPGSQETGCSGDFNSQLRREVAVNVFAILLFLATATATPQQQPPVTDTIVVTASALPESVE